jgi:two-component system, OmpR family, sensor histidine kinase QseC
MMPPRSLRAQLGLTQALALGGVLLLLFLVLDGLIDNALYSRFDAALMDRGGAVAAIAEGADGSRNLERAWPGYSPAGHEDFYEIVDQSGQALAQSASSGNSRLAAPAPWPPLHTPLLYDLLLPDGHKGRGVVLPLGQREGVGSRWLLVAAERESVDALEAQMHLILMLGTTICLLLAIGVSWLVIRRGLRPVDALGATALARVNDSGAPALPVARLPSELQPLGRTLEVVLSRLTRALDFERRLARDMAHELRTPLAEILALTQTTPSDALHGARQRQEIGHAARALTQTVDALLTVARIEGGLQAPVHDPLDLVALLRQALQSARAELPEREVALEGPVECWILCDAQLLKPILINLLRNAIEYARPGSPVKVLLSGATDAPKLAISNALDQRGAAVPSATAKHAGRGLAIARNLARAIDVELGADEEGGCFVASLSGFKPI